MLSQKSLPNLKRKQKVLPLSERVSLERVLGFTISNSSSISTDPNTGLIAYPAGCVVVLYNPQKNKQSYLVNGSKKAITCLTFSKDGRHLATGESGHQPALRVWDMEDMTQIAELKGHHFGINVVIFSPNQKYLISVGSQYDMMVNVWNWRAQCKVASNKVAAKVTGISFTEDGSTFVTVGNRHVKFWNMDSSKSRIKETVPLKGHSGILREQKNNFFCGVCCGSGETANKTFTITRSGLLCEFNGRRLLDKWVELKTTSASCIVAGEHHIYIGCANGIVRIFSAATLNYLSTLHRPHHLGVDVAAGLDPSSVSPAPVDAIYPDTIAISLDDEACKLTCVYNDHSLYIWDVHDLKKIGISRSFLYHSGAIWGLEIYPELKSDLGALPAGSFITCSSDDTVRVWNLDSHMATDTAYKRNIYSNELLKVIYTDPDLSNIKEVEFNPAGKTDKTDTQETRGVRSICISSDGQHMASGDRVGNIRIHHLQFMDQVHVMEAHDSEVLCLEFSNPYLGKKMLASTSRDRLLHVFDADNDYDLIQTLDDHSAAITSVHFYETEDQQLGMISCGMDKSLLFRTAQMDPDLQFVMTRHLVGKTTLYDMCLDPKQKFVATACQDRNIRIYNLKNGKHKKSYSGSVGSDGNLLRVAQDRTGSYVATSCSDKNMCIMDFFTGECLASMYGHSELIYGMKFLNDLKHVVSVSGDGCIFVWRLPYQMTEHMHNRLRELGGNMNNLGSNTNNNMMLNRHETSLTNHSENEQFVPMPSILDDLLPTPDKNANLPERSRDSNKQDDYCFSMGQLPSWAKRQVLQGTTNRTPTNSNSTSSAVVPTGRWAQRAVVKPIMDDNAGEQSHYSMTVADHSRLLLDQTDNNKTMVQTIIADDEDNCDDEDDEDFKQFNSSQIFTSDKITFGRDTELEEEEPEDRFLPESHSVFFPPKEEHELEGIETVASSYKVFEGDSVSVAESEGTEPLSLESDEDDTNKTNISTPTSPDGGQLLKKHLGLEDCAEDFKHTIEDAPSLPTNMTNRLSMSTRFLSRSQQHVKNGSKIQTNTLQQRKEEMAQAVMETRRRLLVLGWKVGDWDTINELDPDHEEQAVPERDLTPSPFSTFDQNADQPQRRRTSTTNSVGRIPSKDQVENAANGAFAMIRNTKPQCSPGGSTPERRRWPQTEQQSPSPVGNSRKWKSMLDVTGRNQSPTRKTPNSPDSPDSPTRMARSHTPVVLATMDQNASHRRSLSPSPIRHASSGKSSTGAVIGSTGMTRSRSRRDKDGKSDVSVDNEDLTSDVTPQNSSINANTGIAASRASTLKKNSSYQLATKSSKAKNRQSTGCAKETSKDALSRRSFIRRVPNTNLKNKFKSTPDLLVIDQADNDVNVKGMVSSKTTEDLVDSGCEGSDTKDLYLQHMLASRQKKDLFASTTEAGKVDGLESPTPSGSSGYVSANSSALSGALASQAGVTTALQNRVTSNSSLAQKGGQNVSKGDRDMMPPPSTVSVAKYPRRTTVPDMTLLQAKEIILGKSFALSSSRGSSNNRRSLPTEGSPTMLHPRPRSALSGVEVGKRTDTEPVITRNTINSSHVSNNITAQTADVANTMTTSCTLSKSSMRLPLTSVRSSGPGSIVKGTAVSRSSITSSFNPLASNSQGQAHSQDQGSFLDANPMDLPVKDTYVSQNKTNVLSGDSLVSSSRAEVKTNVMSGDSLVGSNRAEIRLMMTSATTSSAVPNTAIQTNGICAQSTQSSISLNIHSGVNVNSSIHSTGDPTKTAVRMNNAAIPSTEGMNATFVVNSDLRNTSTLRHGMSPSHLVKGLGRAPSPINVECGEPDVAGQDEIIANEDTESGGIKRIVESAEDSNQRLESENKPISEIHGILSHLTRRRERSCVSPTRQLNSTVTIMPSQVNQPPSIPAPLTPPRELGTNTGSPALSPKASEHGNTSGRLSPTKGLASLNREVMTARWQRAQQNRERHHGPSTTYTSGQSEHSTAQTSLSQTSSSDSETSLPPGRASSLDQKYLQDRATVRSPAVEPRSTSLEPGLGGTETRVLPSMGENLMEEVEAEVKRPDKTRSNPPVSLTTEVTRNVTESGVILAKPSPIRTVNHDAQTNSTKPIAHVVLSNTSQRTQHSEPTSPHVLQGTDAKGIAEQFKDSLDRIIFAYNKINKETSDVDHSQDLSILRETLTQGQASLNKLMAPPGADFTPYLSFLSSTSTANQSPNAATSQPGSAHSTGVSTDPAISPTQQSIAPVNSQIVEMLNYYSEQLCCMVAEKQRKYTADKD